MTEVFLILAFIAFILLTTVVICIAQEIDELKAKIDELKEKLEQHRIRFNYLEFDYLSISEIEKRLYQLEEALELKEYFDKESLNKKRDEINQTKSRDNPI